MSHRTILVPVGQPENAERGRGGVSRRSAHVLPDLADSSTHALITTRMSFDAASSDFRKFKSSAERELQRQSSGLKRLFDEAVAQAGAATQDAAHLAQPAFRLMARSPASRAR